MAKNVHVVPNEGKWGVKIEGNEKMSRNFDTQKKAADYGKQRAIDNHSELLIHRPNGTIREKNSFGNDPKKIKG
jgi:hypothetical protein